MGDGFADHTVEQYIERYGKECAHITMSRGQVARYLIIMVILLTFANYDYKQFFILVNFVVCAIYMVTILFKFFTVLLSIVRRSEVRVAPEELAELNEADLPVYTILVPLYMESNVAESIMKAIEEYRKKHEGNVQVIASFMAFDEPFDWTSDEPVNNMTVAFGSKEPLLTDLEELAKTVKEEEGDFIHRRGK